jgi:hypothetical protein
LWALWALWKHVILSVAKDLSKIIEILRYAQDDKCLLRSG